MASYIIFIGIWFLIILIALFIFWRSWSTFSSVFKDISILSKSNSLFSSKKSVISRKFTFLLWFKSNLFNIKIFFKKGYKSSFIKSNNCFISWKLSLEVISIKNKAHWQSNKQLWIWALSFNIFSSINTSYKFRLSISLFFNSYSIWVVIIAIKIKFDYYIILWFYIILFFFTIVFII